MINIRAAKENKTIFKNFVLLKDPNFDFDLMINLYENLINEKIKLDFLLNKKNEIVRLSKNSATEDLIQKSKNIQIEINNQQESIVDIEHKFNYLYLRCPNIIQESIPHGNKELNKTIKTIGEKIKFDFIPKNHVELLSKKKEIDFEKGIKLSGSGFIVYDSQISWILYRLAMIFIKNNEKFGFNLIVVPHLAREETLIAASNLPKFQEDLFFCERDNLYLIPTSEVSLSCLHENSILKEELLPIRYTCWTKCFRREAGGYGSNERGLIRIHEFEKVEIFSFCHPDKSENEHDLMLECAESLLKEFKLHYKVVLLASQDCSFASSKTYDLEVWLPGQNQYKEVSSISNCSDYQARRSKTRFKKNENDSTTLVHTLNGSSVALPRIMVALFETYQNKNGEIDFKKINEILNLIERKYL